MQNKRRKDLHKYIMKAVNADDVIGTHAYGKVARVHRPIPTRRPSADEREAAVSGYRHSMVGSVSQYRTAMPPEPDPTTHDTGIASSDVHVQGNRPKSGSVDSAKTGADPVERKHRFIEPPRRNFNRFD